MNDTGIPEDVERFVTRCIDSVEQLEIILLLRQRSVSWTPEAIARELRIHPQSVMTRLAALERNGLVAQTIPRQFVFGSNDRDHIVDAAARVYAQRRVAMIGLIFSRPHGR